MTIEEKKQLLKKYGGIDDRIEQLRRAKENSRLCDKYHSTEFEEKIKGSKNKGSIVEVTVEKRAEDWDALIKKDYIEEMCERAGVAWAKIKHESTHKIVDLHMRVVSGCDDDAETV